MQREMFSAQGKQLLDFYTEMSREGYIRQSGEEITNAFSDFELRKFRAVAKTFFEQTEVTTVLDYGGGGSDWDLPGFDPESGLSAREYFKLAKTQTYEPARGLFKSEMRDCVTCIDVLEHIFIADLPAVLNDIFRHAGKAIMLNIACYPAAAMLPNGENAHITVRDPLWWKGVIDVASIEFPKITVLLICSMSYSSGILFPPWKAAEWSSSEKMVVPPPQGIPFGEGVSN